MSETVEDQSIDFGGGGGGGGVHSVKTSLNL